MPDCIFCKIVAGQIPATKVYEDSEFVAFLDIAPVNPGHTLVIPKAHYDRFDTMPPEEAAKLFACVRKLAPGIVKGVGADSYNLGVNSGPAAGQVVFHTHVHVVPRLPKDGYRLWAGAPYQSEAAREQVAQKIRLALKSGATRTSGAAIKG